MSAVLLAVLLLAAPDAPLKEEPKVVRLQGGGYRFNDAAYDQLDGELKRLQAVEAEHKAEDPISTAQIVLISGGIGLAIGFVVGAVVVGVIKK